MIPAPTQSQRFAAVVQAPPAVPIANAGYPELYAASQYVKFAEASVFAKIATEDDYSAALVYQNAIAVAKSGVVVDINSANMSDQKPIEKRPAEDVVAEATPAKKACQLNIAVDDVFEEQLRAAVREAMAEALAPMNARLKNQGARVVNGRCGRTTPLRPIVKEKEGHPLPVATPQPVGAVPPPGLVPSTLELLEKVEDHELDEIYNFYNDLTIAPYPSLPVEARRERLVRFLTIC
eukprot:EG_transcript_25228